jgi:hypothetical protein
MRLVLLACVLLIGCATNNSTAGQQFRQLTRQQHASFSSPGDATSMSPTPDTGIFGQGDATLDCSGCPPR